jgi:hypothetical protein
MTGKGARTRAPHEHHVRRHIADGLNERGIPTARGSGKWSATQVMRVLARGPAGPFVVVSAAA